MACSVSALTHTNSRQPPSFASMRCLCAHRARCGIAAPPCGATAGIRVQACSTTFKGKLMFAQVTNPPPELLQQFGALCSHHSAWFACLFVCSVPLVVAARFALLAWGCARSRGGRGYPVVLLVPR